MDIPTKDDILRQWALHDPIVYACLQQQAALGWTDEELWRAMAAMMADRHAHIQKAYQNLLAKIPPSPFVQINV
jgi:hypothetical protein